VATNVADITNFSDVYLGPAAADPTLRNDGSALQAGDLYFDTVNDVVKVYDGAAWLAAFASLAGALVATNNLSDLTSKSTARQNLDLEVGVDVQAYDATIVVDADIGVTVQAYDSNLTSFVSTFTLPTVDGTADQILKTDGAGNIGFADAGGGIDTYDYVNRNDLRSVDGPADSYALIQDLGLFKWESGSTEPDDDESCFATTSGRWLIEAVHWDVVDSWNEPDNDVRDGYIDGVVSLASATSVGVTTSVSFSGTVIGAQAGSKIITSPPARLGDTVSATGRLSFHAYCDTINVVTIVIANGSAGSATINSSCRVNWPVRVIL
jgi:hypothetical protein